MKLPIFNSDNRIFSQMQTQWASMLQTLLDNPSLDSIILPNVPLSNGTTVINHLLSRKMQGWRIVDITGAASIYRSAPLNDKTLTLTSNAAVTISLECF